MGRFIVATFLLMGFAFYELSGGGDFEPRGVRSASATSAAEPTQGATETAMTSSQTIIAPRKTAQTAAEPQVTSQADAAAIEAAVQLAQARVKLSDGLSLANSGNAIEGLQLASLSDGLVGLRTAPKDETPATLHTANASAPKSDLREIKASRVNMRQGPGTDFPVITRLSLGQDVEVLSESGDGWLRLRTYPEGEMGWISASLVTNKAP